jgi:Fibronectin type III domain
LSGIAGYKVVFGIGSAPTSCSAGTVVPGYDGTSTSYTLTGLINQTYGYRVCAIDNAGNSSTGVTTTAKPLATETNPPTGSVIIDGGAEATKSTLATLTLTASDDSPPIQMCISNTTSCASWTAFAATKSWALTTGNGTKTVYAWFRNMWGNTTPTPYSDSIIVDTVAPTNGTVTAIPGAGQIALTWGGFTDALSGIAGYKVVFGIGSAPTSCSAGTVVPGYDGTSTSYTLTGLTNGKTYYYRVCAIDNAGNMSSGSTANAKPVP